MILDVRLVQDRDGKWRASLEGERVTEGHDDAATALAHVAAVLRPRTSRMLTISTYLEQRQADALRALSEVTGVPQSVYAREAVDLVLAHHGAAPCEG